MRILEALFVVILFLLYLGIWKVKQVFQIKSTGINPKVMACSTSEIQNYMNNLMKIITVYAAIIIILHAMQFQVGSLFNRMEAISFIFIDIIGFIVGIIGLMICLYSQIKMGKSWRVGIDEKVKTDLITEGLYKYIRNPTYLGLFILNLGVWLIWPTWTVFILNLIFILFLDIQVRCEEDHLTRVHGKQYINYKERTKRYFPYVY